jgi:hypothetical protein
MSSNPDGGILVQLARGEPVKLATIIAAIFGTLGAQVTDGQAQNIITAVACIAAGFMGSRYSTPQANPAPATKTVHLEAGDGTPVTTEASDVKPVVTLRLRPNPFEKRPV